MIYLYVTKLGTNKMDIEIVMTVVVNTFIRSNLWMTFPKIDDLCDKDNVFVVKKTNSKTIVLLSYSWVIRNPHWLFWLYWADFGS